MKVRNIVRGGQVPQEKSEQARQNRRRPTKEEQILWRSLKGDGLGGFHFRRQQVIRGFIVDFYCSQASLIVEVDGPGHRQTEIYDSERRSVLEGLGLKAIRFGNGEIRRRLGAVLSAILAECEQGLTVDDQMSTTDED